MSGPCICAPTPVAYIAYFFDTVIVNHVYSFYQPFSCIAIVHPHETLAIDRPTQ